MGCVLSKTDVITPESPPRRLPSSEAVWGDGAGSLLDFSSQLSESHNGHTRRAVNLLQGGGWKSVKPHAAVEFVEGLFDAPCSVTSFIIQSLLRVSSHP